MSVRPAPMNNPRKRTSESSKRLASIEENSLTSEIPEKGAPPTRAHRTLE